MQISKRILIPSLYIILVGLLSACLPLTMMLDRVPTPTFTPVSLPPTWTEVPPTETPLATDPPEPVEAGIPTPSLSSDQVPFREVTMISAMEGWAWSYPDYMDVRIWHTSDGGLSWFDVSPEPNATEFVFALDALTAWAIACQTSGDDCEPLMAVKTGQICQKLNIMHIGRWSSHPRTMVYELNMM
jgi:hypothetical protein